MSHGKLKEVPSATTLLNISKKYAEHKKEVEKMRDEDIM
jgi:hypothetical protein